MTVTKSYARGGWATPLLVLALVLKSDIFGVISVGVGVRSALWVTLYGVGLVQVTEGAAFATGEVLDAVAGAETWQEDTTVAVTVNEAVRVAAREGLGAKTDARRPKANAKVMYFIAYALFETSEEHSQLPYRHFLRGTLMADRFVGL